MSWRFRKHFKILRNIHLNVGKKGINSVTLGRGWFTTNVNRKGIKQNFSARGTGLSYQSKRVPFATRTPRITRWCCPNCFDFNPWETSTCAKCGLDNVSQIEAIKQRAIQDRATRDSLTVVGVIFTVIVAVVGLCGFFSYIGRTNTSSNSSSLQ